jgi:2-haloacid dehalogenase
MAERAVRAILFDVFGTVVDWRASIIDAGIELSGRTGLDVDWSRFADDWRRQGYLQPIARITKGEQPWQDVDSLLRAELDRLAQPHGLASTSPTERDALVAAWRRLRPWPDTQGGLQRLREGYLIAPLSNGSFALLTELAKWAALRWDCIISTELFGTFKPDPRTYLGAAELLGLRPDQVMMAAAHVGDLRAAQAVGLATAYIPRPLEWGPTGAAPEAPDSSFDIVATDFHDLADQLTPNHA